MDSGAEFAVIIGLTSWKIECQKEQSDIVDRPIAVQFSMYGDGDSQIFLTDWIIFESRQQLATSCTIRAVLFPYV